MKIKAIKLYNHRKVKAICEAVADGFGQHVIFRYGQAAEFEGLTEEGPGLFIVETGVFHGAQMDECFNIGPGVGVLILAGLTHLLPGDFRGLPALCRETNSKLVLITDAQSMADAAVGFDEVCRSGAGWTCSPC